MKKEKINIHSHIIREDYESKKKKPKPWDVSDKPMLLSELQNNTTLVEKIRTMHNDFLEIDKPELPQIDKVDSNQMEPQIDNQLMNSLDISELIKSYQELENDEQKLVDKRQCLLVMEQDLRNRLIQEIFRKRENIKKLQDEISALQNSFVEIEQELDVKSTID